MVKTLRGRKRGRNPLDQILETVRVHIDGEPKEHEEGAGYMVSRILREQKLKILILEEELEVALAAAIKGPVGEPSKSTEVTELNDSIPKSEPFPETPLRTPVKARTKPANTKPSKPQEPVSEPVPTPKKRVEKKAKSKKKK